MTMISETHTGMPMVRLRVTIQIDIDAEDYRDAAAHQGRLEQHMSALQAQYPTVGISVKERRGPRTPAASPLRTPHVRTGRAHAYD